MRDTGKKLKQQQQLRSSSATIVLHLFELAVELEVGHAE